MTEREFEQTINSLKDIIGDIEMVRECAADQENYLPVELVASLDVRRFDEVGSQLMDVLAAMGATVNATT